MMSQGYQDGVRLPEITALQYVLMIIGSRGDEIWEEIWHAANLHPQNAASTNTTPEQQLDSLLMMLFSDVT